MPAERPYTDAEHAAALGVLRSLPPPAGQLGTIGGLGPTAPELAARLLDAAAPLIAARAHVAEERDRQTVAAALRWTATYLGGTALHVLAEQVAAGDPRAGDLMRYVQHAHATTEENTDAA